GSATTPTSWTFLGHEDDRLLLVIRTHPCLREIQSRSHAATGSVAQIPKELGVLRGGRGAQRAGPSAGRIVKPHLHRELRRRPELHPQKARGTGGVWGSPRG